MRRSVVPLSLLLVVAASLHAEEVTINQGQLAMFKPPLPDVMRSEDNPITEAKVDLGRMLYYDKRFSVSNTVSCNTCHPLKEYGVDHLPVSLGHEDKKGTRNAPTVYNAAGHIAQFWDGRAADVEEQALGPVLNPVEMAMPSRDYVLRVIESVPGYVERFEEAFPERDNPITFENFGKAIGAFERKLTTPAPWDAFLAGDKDALTDKQKQGFITFMTTGCMTCHNGTYLGGNMYQKVGLVKPWPNQEDKGRYEHTGNEADKMFFKVPSLRNVAKTEPYFHDGSVEDLGTAVKMMAEHQLGRDLSDEKTQEIIAFLKSLTGEIPTEYIEKPELPDSGPNTPKPQLGG